MSSAVTSEMNRPECASRLIPGQGISRLPSRKRPHSVAVEGGIRVDGSPRERVEARTFSLTRDLLLPTPVVAGSRWELGSALVTDYCLILASWTTVSCVEFVLRRSLLPGSPVGSLVGILRAGQLHFAFAFAVMATLLGYSEGLYQPVFVDGTRPKAAILAKSVGWATILTGGFAWSMGFAHPFGWSALLGVIFSFAGLVMVRRFRQQRRNVGSRNAASRNVLIVGAGAAGQQVADYLARHPESGQVVRGFLDNSSVAAFGVLGAPENLAAIARAEFVDEVILAVPHRGELAQKVIREARRNHLDVRVVPDFFGCAVRDPWIETLGVIPLVTLHREELPVVALLMKRALDVVVSVSALLVTAPILLLITILIRLDSPGPVLYAALRVGRKGKRFRCYKFRTMSAQANELREQLRKRNQRQGPCFKMVDDPRITRAGRWLRQYSLDELPQLWNVLRGEMSLVGPRPHPLDDVARYELEHLRRLDVTPGITGLWQVMARRSASFQTNMALDLEYIERWSLWMDLRILLKTLSVVVQGTGS